MFRASVLFSFFLACLPAFAAGPVVTNWSGPYRSCLNRAELVKTGHMELGVRVDTTNPEIASAFWRALDFWSNVLDMDFHPEPSSDCALALVDGTAEILHTVHNVARAQFSDLANFQGLIAFDPHASDYMSADEMYATAVHELGHLFGLRHNPSATSIMYYLDCDGTSSLDLSDLDALAARHALRAMPREAIPVVP